MVAVPALGVVGLPLAVWQRAVWAPAAHRSQGRSMARTALQAPAQLQEMEARAVHRLAVAPRVAWAAMVRTKSTLPGAEKVEQRVTQAVVAAAVS